MALMMNSVKKARGFISFFFVTSSITIQHTHYSLVHYITNVATLVKFRE